MANTSLLVQLRQYALEEQFLAAAEGRAPDRDMLDELGRTVLHDFTPVVCKVEEAHYLDFNPDTGYEYETHDNNQPVVGAFGGFHVQPVVEDFGMDGKINRYEVGFFVLDTKYNDTGFVCPVVGSELFDVAGVLEGDSLYEELCIALAEEEIDMLKVQDIYQRIHDPEKLPYFLAYLRSVVAPVDVYGAISAGAYIMMDGPATEQQRSVLYREPLWMNISKYHRFTSGSIMKGPQELAVLMGKQRRLYIPLRFIEGSEPPRPY